MRDGTVRLLASAGAALSLAGCATFSAETPMTAYPIPVLDNRPNPTPVPGYRVICDSRPTLVDPFFANYTTGCRQVIDPGPAILRARG